MDANETVNFNSSHLENGNESKGLSGGLGDGTGNWRLDLETTLDIEPLAYVRSGDGSLAGVHDSVSSRSMRHHVLTFNPGSNLQKRSLLRLVNTSGIDTDVVVTGLDDRGEAPPGGEVRLTLPADEARTLSARALEAGGEGFEGRFGDGAGKWQVFVTAGRPIQVMSLLASPGNLVNLSAGPGDATIRGGPGRDVLTGGNGDDVFIPGDNDAGVDIVNGSAGDDMIVYTGSGPTAYQHIGYADLGAGITATIDGVANRGSIDKGSAGADTLVNVATPLDAGWTAPGGGFGISGTRFSDTFHLTLDEQWMQVVGGAGNDTFNIRSGLVRLDYRDSPGGVDVDLGAGRARNDGHGNTDTINGSVWGVRGSDSSDVIVGSGNNETFKGRLGNDRIDGGGGWDRLDFRWFTDFDDDDFPGLAVEDLNVNLARGTATGTWKGNAFSYRISNIERVSGGGGDDVITLGSGVEYRVDGSTGNDRIDYSASSDRTYPALYYQQFDRTPESLGSGGVTVTLDGAANRATVDKGTAGTDTLVDVARPLEGDGLAIHGSDNADVFNLRLGEGQWMQVYGRAGADTFNIHRDNRSTIRISYNNAPAGIHVDLGAGRARNDGYGDTDTISGHVREIRGSDFTDTIIGSGNDESFIGRAGNDTIDGGGGWDRLRLDRTCCVTGNIAVDLAAGTATGTWNGEAFSYRISNIEEVRGGPGDDTLRGNSGGNTLRGYAGDDTLQGGAGDDRLYGGDGDDVFVFERGHGEDNIADFTNGEDVILLRGLGLSKSDVLNNAGAWSEGTGTWINLTDQGGGMINLPGFDFSNLDESDFLL